MLLKVGRAESHLRELDALLSGFADTKSMVAEPVYEQFDDGQGAWGARLRCLHGAPDEASVLVGDFLHNLRASLDYLARALVMTSGNRPIDGTGGTTFPIREQPKQHGHLRVNGTVAPDVGLVIESFQPYKAAPGAIESHPLAMLHRFSNIDKHRSLHLPLIAAVEPVSMIVAKVDPLPIGIIQATLRTFSDGDWLIVPAAPFPETAKVEVVSALRPIISLEGAYHYPGMGTVSLVDQLDYMLRTVRDAVVPSFREFFLDPWPDEVFSYDPVPGPLGVGQTADDVLAATDGMISVLANRYGSDRYLVLGLVEGLSA